LNAIRIDKPIKVDGLLDESFWTVADKAGDFIQRSPEPGGVPSQLTEVAVLYNDAYIYIGAWMYDDKPGGVLTELTSRDRGGNSDRFSIYFDTYNDDLNAYEFSVSAAGVQSDARISPGSFDRNWDAGWYSEVSITDEGWFVEIEIPLSVLRFPDIEEQYWGMNFSRTIRRNNETVYWDEINPKVSGFVNQFGNLSGIKGIKTPLRLSITPYVSTYINRHTNPDPNLSNTSTIFRGGLDLMYGINDAFTLNMMLIPDFGQVISDNDVLNLGPYEVYYEERRQFFTEGTELFNKAGVFYSRRIGGQPIGYDDVENQLEEGEEIVFVCHRHIFVFIRDIFRVFILHGALTAFFWYFFPQLLLVYVIWVGIGVIRTFFVLQDWYYDVWLLTNMGIISVEWTGYFDRTSARVEYPSIEGVTYAIKGVWQTIFNYGNITLAKFGGPSEMILKEASNPKKVERNVLMNQERFMTSKNFQDQEVLKQLLSDLVVEHVKKHGLPNIEEKEASESVKEEQ